MPLNSTVILSLNRKTPTLQVGSSPHNTTAMVRAKLKQALSAKLSLDYLGSVNLSSSTFLGRFNWKFNPEGRSFSHLAFHLYFAIMVLNDPITDGQT